jgi:hypothetical protein
MQNRLYEATNVRTGTPTTAAPTAKTTTTTAAPTAKTTTTTAAPTAKTTTTTQPVTTTTETVYPVKYQMKTSNNKFITVDNGGWLSTADEGSCFEDEAVEGVEDKKVYIKVHTYGRYLGWTKLETDKWAKVGVYRTIEMKAKDQFEYEGVDGKLRLKNSEGRELLKKGDYMYFSKEKLPVLADKAYEEKYISKVECPPTETPKEPLPDRVLSFGFNPDGETFEQQVAPSESEANNAL